MKVKKIVSIILICCLCCGFSGCWDSVEIDRKGFVSTIAIDVGPEISKKDELKNRDSNKSLENKNLEKLNLIFGYPNMSELGPDKGSTATEKVLKVGCYSMADGIMEASTKSSRDMSMEHTKLFIFSKELLMHQDTFKEVIEYLQREPSINKNTKVVVVDGSAEEFVKFKPEMENNIEAYVNGLMENSQRNSAIFPIDLNTVFRKLIETNSVLIPVLKLDKEENDIVLDGATLIKDFRYDSTIGTDELSNISIVTGSTRSGKRVICKDDVTIDYVIDEVERQLKINYDENNNLVIDMELRIGGQLKNFKEGEKIFNDEEIKDLQGYFNNALKEEFTNTIRYTQEELQTDLFGLQEYIEKYKPSIWKKVKDNWRGNYSEAKINLEVKTKINTIGIIK
ncbi:spore germination protein [Clostridium collagenovorans DSM 3089]|uniref:Spore germination protein n=1 Tax=Clostridium collagenovorans DSM 3089 TaxID=1121306 RepID=A0A1M5W3R4_9CLOT|nr:Ger(x)C family spore germination protein [Clostridium collagenovorans]SHH82088.1 spore germination protein [Clostridium collagenovorans DSM 3089]